MDLPAPLGTPPAGARALRQLWRRPAVLMPVAHHGCLPTPPVEGLQPIPHHNTLLHAGGLRVT